MKSEIKYMFGGNYPVQRVTKSEVILSLEEK